MLPMGLESINFELLLNRMPEVQGGAKAGDYQPAISEEEFEQIKERGTHYDLEFIYRIANGRHNTSSRDETGDIGVLLPNPSDLILGPFRSYGSIISVSATDQMYSADMVPMLTKVQVSFQRFLATQPSEEQMETLRSTGVTYTNPDAPPGGSSSTAEESTDADAGQRGANEDQPEKGNTFDAPVPGFNRVTTGRTYRTSGKQHRGWDYGMAGVDRQPVYSTREGEVMGIHHLTVSYGKHVIIRTENIWHYYCHLSVIEPSLKVGQRLPGGSFLGRVGSTGRSEGPHLHYEERVDDKDWSRRPPQWAENTGNVE